MSQAEYAAVDWGTSSFRLWLIDRAGGVLQERRSQEGMMAAAKLGFAAVLQSHLEAVGAAPGLPVVVCGMAGARQGWVEAGYVDTPARLAEYAARYGANPLAWSFLTGPADAIEAAVTGGFKVGMGKEKIQQPEAAGQGETFWQIFHGENLVLVDRQLRIRGYFEATPQGIDTLMAAAGRVANGG